MFGHVTLHEHGRHVGLEPDGEQHGCQLQRALTDDARCLGDGERMEVDDAVEGVARVLARHPVAQRSEVVPEVHGARGLHARQHTGGRSSGRGVGRGGGGHGARGYTALAVTHSVVWVTMSIDVDTPVYSGPFDMLLQLILREQVDIYEVSLSTIVDAYLAEIDTLRALDLDVATSFLLIAATLVELKARRLLPNMADMDLDDEFALWEERDLLLARLLEAKTFKDVATVFARLAEDADCSFPRLVGPDERFADVMPDMLEGTSLTRLRNAAIAALTPRPVPTVDLFHVNPITTTVADAVAELIDELPRVGRISFRRLTGDLVDRIEVIIRFLAVLELFKQGVVELDQPERFGDIEIAWCADADVDGEDILVDAYEG